MESEEIYINSMVHAFLLTKSPECAELFSKSNNIVKLPPGSLTITDLVTTWKEKSSAKFLSTKGFNIAMRPAEDDDADFSMLLGSDDSSSWDDSKDHDEEDDENMEKPQLDKKKQNESDAAVQKKSLVKSNKDAKKAKKQRPKQVKNQSPSGLLKNIEDSNSDEIAIVFKGKPTKAKPEVVTISDSSPEKTQCDHGKHEQGMAKLKISSSEDLPGPSTTAVVSSSKEFKVTSTDLIELLEWIENVVPKCNRQACEKFIRRVQTLLLPIQDDVIYGPIRYKKRIQRSANFPFSPRLTTSDCVNSIVGNIVFETRNMTEEEERSFIENATLWLKDIEHNLGSSIDPSPNQESLKKVTTGKLKKF